ncbi:DNA polymerase III subunit beta [Streptomyces sp. NPDC048417]|uniref:DNA polymerase III subunit beta n=1 Tax=Streptomyces sp. NPDC048417 TaxID=3155387 RepID=UPI00343EC76B
MKLTIDTDKLADAAQWALRAVPGNPPIPVMAGLRIEAVDDNTLTLAGYDHYRSARAAEDCEVSEPGTLLVPGRVFTDIVKAFPKGKPTTLALDGTDLALSCGTAHILLPTLPLDDYPTLPTISAASGTVDGATLAAAGARVAAASSTDETLVNLTGVQFGLSDTTITLSATDRYTFHVADMPWTPNPAPRVRRCRWNGPRWAMRCAVRRWRASGAPTRWTGAPAGHRPVRDTHRGPGLFRRPPADGGCRRCPRGPR